MKRIISILSLLILINTCEDLEHTNPVDPDFVLEAPTNLSVAVINDQSVRLNWDDNCKQEEGFIVECKIEGNAYAKIADLNANTETYTDTNLIYGKNYTYRVKAFINNKESDYSNESDVIEMIIPAPTNLTATIIDEQSVQLTWEDNCTFETGYSLERKEEDDTSIVIAVLNANTESYTDDEGLNFGIEYTYRIQAYTNSNLSEYSEKVITNVNVVVDIDGNVYQTVKIGDQYWTAENLKVTHYRNGETIPKVTSNLEWEHRTTSAYCNYDNDDNNAGTYGSLYNWFAVDDSRQIAPEGWHVPSDEEWQNLVDYLGGSSVAGGKMKETGTEHWISPNTGATNESGFSALPGGSRTSYGCYNVGSHAYFWSSTESNSSSAWTRQLHRSSSVVSRYYDFKQHGFSVRCLRD